MSQELKRIEGGLADLPKKLGKITWKVPRIDPEMAEDPQQLTAVIEQKAEGAKQIREEMSHALAYLDKVEIWIEQFEEPEKKRLAQETIADSVAEMEHYTKQCLSHEEIAFRRAAGMTHLNHVFDRDVKSLQEAQELLQDLIAKEFFEKDSEGTVAIGYDNYSLSREKWAFSPEEAKQIEEFAENFSRKLKQLIRGERIQKRSQLERKNYGTIKELKQGKEGEYFLADIPAENYIDQSGQEKWRGGGSLAVKVTESGEQKFISVVDSVGAIQPSMSEAMKLKVSLPHRSLVWKIPPGAGKAFIRLVDGVMNRLGLKQEDAQNHVRKEQALWYLIQRAFRAFENKEEMDALKEKMAAEADISAQEFYGIECEPQEGQALLVFEGIFMNKNSDPPVCNLFGIFNQKRDEDGELTVTFLKGPEHVEKFLAESKDKEFPAKQNFKWVPESLGRVLRGIKGQTNMAVQIQT